jgi:hypothetical protein
MRRSLKAAAVCGICGPILFAGVVITLSFLELGFMLTLGWNPLTAPTRDWPSGLALGPAGLVMTAAFPACGLLLVLFSFGLHRGFQKTRAGPAASILLAVAGFAMCLLAFSTDPTNNAGPPTLHGLIHDAAFAVLGCMLLLSLAASGFAFRSRGKWTMAVFSWVTAVLIVPSFTAKGIVFYFFLAAFLAWCEAAAVQLLRSELGGVRVGT